MHAETCGSLCTEEFDLAEQGPGVSLLTSWSVKARLVVVRKGCKPKLRGKTSGTYKKE